VDQARETNWLRRNFIGLIVAFMVLSTVTVFVVDSVEGAGGDNGVLDIAVYGSILAAGTLIALFFSLPRLLGLFTPENSERSDLVLLVLFLGLTIPAAFGRTCRGLSLLYGGFSGIDRSAPIVAQNVVNHWDTFAYSWLLDSFTFNASQVFNWIPTPIHPTAWWAGLLVVGFSIVADTILFAGVINVFRLVRSRRG
jgi:hypothetical protein